MSRMWLNQVIQTGVLKNLLFSEIFVVEIVLLNYEVQVVCR